MADVAARTRAAGRSGAARKVVLFGWAAKAVVYLALAYLVLQLALGAASEQTSTTGALQYIAQGVPGAVAIVVLGLGLLAYAVGRVLEVTTLARPQVDAGEKAKAAVLAVVYAALALSAFSLVGLAGRRGGGSGGGSTEQKGSAVLLGLPGGQVLVAVLGIAVVLVGLYQAYQGVEQAFMKTLRTGDMPHAARRVVGKLGTAAYVTKGAIFVLLGYFFVQSALTYDPSKARGLDAALKEVAQQPWGRIVLVLVALGLLAYALFSFFEARYRRVGVSATGLA